MPLSTVGAPASTCNSPGVRWGGVWVLQEERSHSPQLPLLSLAIDSPCFSGSACALRSAERETPNAKRNGVTPTSDTPDTEAKLVSVLRGTSVTFGSFSFFPKRVHRNLRFLPQRNSWGEPRLSSSEGWT